MKKRIVVAMSGGVDSSTTAALMRDRGDEVIGVTLKLCGNTSVADAVKVAMDLGIKHHVIDFTKEFDDKVISYFVDTYMAGKTPSPCVLCNREIKFGMLYDFAMNKLGADALVSGHYARIVQQDGEFQLHAAADPIKDQSYFLYGISKDKLARLEFPVGERRKPDVRRLAGDYDLDVADKPESQNVCFVPEDGDYTSVIRGRMASQAGSIGLARGDIVDSSGRVLGMHEGLAHYTIGQRRGVGLSGNSRPYYVLRIEPATNALVVGFDEELAASSLLMSDLNWFVDPAQLVGHELVAKVRSTHRGTPATIDLTDEFDTCRVNFLNSCRAIAPGQACVLYQGTQLVGGGMII